MYEEVVVGDIENVLYALKQVMYEHKLSFYTIVENMEPDMREELASALYAYSANQDVLTDIVQ